MQYDDHVKFPPGCRGIVDVSQAPYFADPTGERDCTQAIRQAIDDLMRPQAEEMDATYRAMVDAPGDLRLGIANRRENGQVYGVYPQKMPQTPVLYFPCGTYLISDTLTYSLQNLKNRMYTHTVGGYELNRCLRIMGQNRDKTIIRLRDHCPGFEFGQERPMVNFMLGERSNVAMSNYLENLTLDAGIGNPGAVGLVFFANNSGAVRNVTIRSRDGQGYAGLRVLHEIVSGCYVRALRVEGFAYGVQVTPCRNYAVFEDLTLIGQTKCGMQVGQTIASIRRITCRGQATCLHVSGAPAHVVCTDGDFEAHNSPYPAIRIDLGCVFLRNIRTAGFFAALDQYMGEKRLPNGLIDEYCTHPGVSLSGEAPRSLALEVPPLPHIPSEEDFSKWGCVNDFGAKGDGVHDDSAAIQAAMNGGKRVVWFQPGIYRITRPLFIPAQVEHVHFMYCDIAIDGALQENQQEAVFHIIGRTNAPLLLEKLFTWERCTGEFRLFLHDSDRTLYLRDVHAQSCALYANTAPGAVVHLENTACTIGLKAVHHHVPAYVFRNQTVWCHAINPERSDVEITNDGGTLWVFGFKTEGGGTLAITRNGGKTEILGGTMSVGVNGDHPVILNDHSWVSAIFSTNGYHSYSLHPVAVQEIRGAEKRFLYGKDLPLRMAFFYLMPLYSGRIGQ